MAELELRAMSTNPVHFSLCYHAKLCFETQNPRLYFLKLLYIEKNNVIQQLVMQPVTSEGISDGATKGQS